MPRHHAVFALAALLIFGAAIVSLPTFVPVDQLEDLTGEAVAVATLIRLDPSVNEYHYEVFIRNLGARPFVGNSLVIVMNRITGLTAKDTAEGIDVRGQDGRTATGSPYFRIPASQGVDLLQNGESRPVIVQLRSSSSDLVPIPTFLVLGLHRPYPKAAETGRPLSLIPTLIRKGVRILGRLAAHD